MRLSPQQPREPIESRSVWWVTMAAIAFAYLYFVPYFSPLNNPNENSRLYQIRAYVESGKLSVDAQIRRYGWVNDLAKREGKHYTGKAPGTTFLGVPIYAALRAMDEARGLPPPSWFRILYALRLFGVILPCLLFVYVFRGFMRRIVHDGHVATILAVVLALGTMLLPYALIYVNHSLTAAAAFGAVIAVHGAVRVREIGTLRSQVGTWLRFVLAGFLLAACTSLDYGLFPISLMLLGFVVWRAGWTWASVVGTCLGAAVPTLLTAAYHQACWGSPFSVSMSFLANPAFQAEAEQGLFGIIGPTATTVWGVLLNPNKGLIYFSPVLAVALVAVVVAALTSRHRRTATITFAVVLWMLLYNMSLVNWTGGWSVGPRYVTVIVPFLVFALAAWWAECRLRARRVLATTVVGLGVPSVVVMSATSTMFPHLQPDYANPLFECIWPLWRDGVTPRSLGRWIADLDGRANQAPFVLVMVLLIGGMVALLARIGRRTGASRLRSAAGMAIAVAIASATLWLQSLPESQDQKRVERGLRWLKTRVWDPPPPGVRRPPSRRR